MHRYRQAGLSLALLALGIGTAEARPVKQPQLAAQQPLRPRLVIVEADGGFVIRCETPQSPQGVPFPRGAFPLGASVRIDRAALQHSNQKDISHGETR